jgi:hypothetical protein
VETQFGELGQGASLLRVELMSREPTAEETENTCQPIRKRIGNKILPKDMVKQLL